jgi:hypothetical protein
VTVNASVESGRENGFASARHHDWSPVAERIKRTALVEEVRIDMGVKPSAVASDLAVWKSAVSVSLCGWAVGWWAVDHRVVRAAIQTTCCSAA